MSDETRTVTRKRLIEALTAIRVRGEMSALSGNHPHMTDADLADLLFAALPTSTEGLREALTFVREYIDWDDADMPLQHRDAINRFLSLSPSPTEHQHEMGRHPQ